MGADRGQPERARLLDEYSEYAVPTRKLTDRPMRRLVDASREEPLERIAPLVKNAQRSVLRAGQRPRRFENAVEDDFEVEFCDKRTADLE
jgi:hypothetical protein